MVDYVSSPTYPYWFLDDWKKVIILCYPSWFFDRATNLYENTCKLIAQLSSQYGEPPSCSTKTLKRYRNFCESANFMKFQVNARGAILYKYGV